MTREGATTSATLLGEPLPVELMNTINVGRDGVHDALADDDAATAWLRAVADRIDAEAGTGRWEGKAAGTAAGDMAGPMAAELRMLRDALRRLAAEATGDPRPPATAPELTRPEAVATLNALARAWPELVWLGDGKPARRYHPGDAVSLIAHQAVELFAGPDRERLRPCLAPNCLLFFAKDHARREWCSPACGNRARVARHYQRRRPGRQS
ncbi:CGNR zinc finger domain-containing protein [Paractinoplanes globisporus]|uniref:CGNR zinc finger domain-containing protein n=1 Tax=Paractinoplanes globisporus TaxID=113565 RepID=A0ABW6WI49_9ACTN|nr:ABATE domain-containing protein [Actinoplanes globisporus]